MADDRSSLDNDFIICAILFSEKLLGILKKKREFPGYLFKILKFRWVIEPKSMVVCNALLIIQLSAFFIGTIDLLLKANTE